MTDVTAQIVHNSSAHLLYFIKLYISYYNFLSIILAELTYDYCM